MKLKPVAIVDTREQRPWRFAHLPAERGTLATGDYSVRGLETLVALERKSLGDLVGCCGRERTRFVAELQRLRAYRFRAVVVEATLAEIERGGWPGKLTPAHVLGSIASWQARYSPFVFAGDADAAARWAERYMYQAARATLESYSAARALLEAATPQFAEPALA
ncbi:MAG: ERCC4 domain-containing protein [Phycisphaerales bacterium]|nr:ERCC4 domain-containing protein [Phycisphaerales bacterium]